MTAPTERFGARLSAAMSRFGPVCVGIDPHPALLASWGLSDDGDGLAQFGRIAVEAAAGHAAAVKPQSALFERHGSAGVAALAEVLRAAREAGILAILDVKRGDIGSTMTAYAQAYLADGAELAADAITLSPYLGFASLAPALDLAEATGRGVFVLALTSNPSGPEVQQARGPDGQSVAKAIAEAAGRCNRRHPPVGDVGLVVGATVGDGLARAGIDLTRLGGPILAPGFGAQGAGQGEIRRVFGPEFTTVLIASSRAILAAGPDGAHLRDAIVGMRDQLVL